MTAPDHAALVRRIDALEERVQALEGAPSKPARVAPPPPFPEPLARATQPAGRPEPAVSASPPRQPASTRPPIPWERLLGVRGAALLGGVALALAGLFFLQYTLAKGWITPELRIALATGSGLLALVGSGPLERRGYRATGNAVAGAGVVILYAAGWAAHALFELVPVWASLGSMVATTIASGALAQRRRSVVIAAFGTLGGFLTPALLSLGAGQPLAIFAYLLLLNLGVIACVRRNDWVELGYLAALGSFAMTAWWLVSAPPGSSLLPALAFLVASALGFTGTGSGHRKLFLQLAALLGPLPYLALFASQGLELPPLAAR